MDRAGLIAVARTTGCADEHGARIFLHDPNWGQAERAELNRLVAMDDPAAENALEGWLGLSTGGTSGGVRLARHDEGTLTAAVRGFQKHFGLAKVNAVDVLPPFHVSGLMARVRCAETAGTHLPWDWKRLEAGERPVVAGDDWVISLVPTQLQRMLAVGDAVDWLRRFRVIFLGGGPTWPALVDDAASKKLRLSLSYGMTETAAMVTALKPEEFLGGARSCGAPLPHAEISVSESGVIQVSGASVFRGYFPEYRTTRTFTTDDLGRIDERGHLHVLGRRDAVIITGGEKVNPTEVESALRATGEFTDVAVIGVIDPEWGQVVVACYPAAGRGPRLDDVAAKLSGTLANFKRPKRYLAIANWPRNAQGKLNRAMLQDAARALLTQV